MSIRRFGMIALAGLVVASIVLSGCQFSYSSYTIGCTSINIQGINGVATLANYDSNGDGVPDQEQVVGYATDGAGNILYNSIVVQQSVGNSVSGENETYDWITAPKYNPITFWYYNPSNGFLPNNVVIAKFTGECAGLPTYEEPVEAAPALPGPDMVKIPDGSVMGTFVADTPLYYAPQADAQTDAVMTAGQSLWVTGVDSSGAYYQVILSGGFYWVPVDRMAPTYDNNVWNGAPLPDQIAK